ncbi:hypothetical protein [Microbacterium sp. Leaf151]|uniref:hypothetical protein n=1 Tax=Microbacterium sp. Leaf151 TaxID=1736276 RepID=UPI0012E3352B|nr:hypothetical protein [Microbacterium sp. Leaf151]
MTGEPKRTIEEATTSYLRWRLLEDLVLRDRLDNEVRWLNADGVSVSPLEADHERTINAHYDYPRILRDVIVLMSNAATDVRIALFHMPTIDLAISLYWLGDDE